MKEIEKINEMTRNLTLFPNEIRNFLIYKKGLWNCSSFTIKTYFSQLNSFVSFLYANGVNEINEINTKNIAKYMIPYKERSTRNLKVFVIKNFLDYCVNENIIPKNPIREVKPQRIEIPKIRFEDLPLDMVDRLYENCNGTREPLRNKLIISLFLSTGLRARELLNLNVNKISVADKRGKVKRKGDIIRPFRFNKNTKILLEQYLQQYEGDIRKRNGKLFSLSYDGLYYLIRKISNNVFHPHLFRHIWASMGRERGMDILLLEELGGWTSDKMLKRYGHISEEKERKEFERVFG